MQVEQDNIFSIRMIWEGLIGAIRTLTYIVRQLEERNGIFQLLPIAMKCNPKRLAT